jgi:hypothetical protein
MIARVAAGAQLAGFVCGSVGHGEQNNKIKA